MVDVTVEARNDVDNPGLVKLQSETWELNIWATTDELWTLAGIEKTDWVQRRTLEVGTCASAPVLWNELDGTVLAAVITVLLQVFDLADCGQHGGKAADVGLDLRGDRWPSAVRASMQAALERARELGITRTDADAGAQP